MPPTKRKRTERVQLMLSADELSAINEFRFRARMPNLAAAVRELIKRGMVSVKKRRQKNESSPVPGWSLPRGDAISNRLSPRWGAFYGIYVTGFG